VPWHRALRRSSPQHHTSGHSWQDDCIRTQPPRYMPSGRGVSGHLPSGRSCQGNCVWTQLSRQLRLDAAVKATAFGRSCQGNCVWTQLPRHMPSGRGVSGHLPSGCSCQGDCVRTQLPRHMPSGREVSGHLPSGRSERHPDEEYHGEQRPDNACHGTTRPDAAVNTTAFRCSCHSTENRSEALNHIRILGVATYSSCIHYT